MLDRLPASQQAREKIAAARAELEACKQAADFASERVLALEAAEERKRQRVKFDKDLATLVSQMQRLEAAIEAYNEAGAGLGALCYTCSEWLKLYGRWRYEDRAAPKILLSAPHFQEIAVVPILGREGHAFVSNHWKHDYAQFDLRDDILVPLQSSIGVRGAEGNKVLAALCVVFENEYLRLGAKLLDAIAFLYLWRSTRDALFAEAGEIAAGVAQPRFPLTTTAGGEYLPWTRINLPSLRPNGEMLWNRNWEPQKLLERASRLKDPKTLAELTKGSGAREVDAAVDGRFARAWAENSGEISINLLGPQMVDA